jgi:VanZ family protein
MLFIGIFIEFVQHFIPNRESSFFDILADGTGIFLATIFKLYIEKSYAVK